MDNDNSPDPDHRAVLGIGTHGGLALHGTPVAPPETIPGAVGIIIGYTCQGEPVILGTESLEWLEDLKAAAEYARARGVVQAGMAARS